MYYITRLIRPCSQAQAEENRLGEREQLAFQEERPRRRLLRRLAARRLWRAEVRYAGALAAFAALAILARLNAYFWWDVAVAQAIQNVPGLLGLMRLVSTIGYGWKPFALTGVTAFIFLIYRRRSEAAGLVFSAAGSTLVNHFLKLLIARPRPSVEFVAIFRPLKSQSFPSGHVTFYVCFFGFLFFVAYAILPKGAWTRRAALMLTALPVLLVGLSRIYLGAHWPSDTLGAYLVSGLWLGLSLHLYRRWKERSTLHAEEIMKEK